MSVQFEEEGLAGLSHKVLGVIERAAVLAADGRHDEAMATRYAAGYHGLPDDRREPPITV